MNEPDYKDQICQINFLLGNLNKVNTVDCVRRIIQYLTVHQWLNNRLKVLVEHSNREFAIQEREKCYNKLEKTLEEIDVKTGWKKSVLKKDEEESDGKGR